MSPVKNVLLRSALFLSVGLLTLSLQAQTVSDEDASKIVHKLADKLVEEYPFPELSEKYKAALLSNDAAGKYSHLTEDALAAKLTADLQVVHKDVHLHVMKDPGMFERSTRPTGEERRLNEEEELEKHRRGGYGFQKVELDAATSTAYISIPGGFESSQEAFEMAASAMGMAAYSKRIIIDVRHDGGGSGQMGRFLASYFYEPGNEQFYLNGFHKDRTKDVQEWTYPYVPGRHMFNAKVYVLVDRNTASACEGFAYAIQKLNRGVIVGDTTAGAGIAGGFVPLGNNLMVFLPVKMVTAPHSNEGWEGTGVIPDVVATGSTDAWAEAKKLILQDMVRDTADKVGSAAAAWKLEDENATALTGKALAQKYAALIGNYNLNISITVSSEGLRWNRAEPGKPAYSYVLREVKPDVLTILEMNKEYGGPLCSRIYVNRTEDGKVESISRKTIMTTGYISTAARPYILEKAGKKK